ncbi:MAG: glycosyltransferase [Planctomycetota bacterium]|nr:glycosyltransferase [Planctomycetota bacterium]
MSEAVRPLPVGVVVPTRNAMPWLPPHVEALRALAPHVQEILVVDSESDDGTTAYIEQHVEHPALRVLSHPPGLYPSWNHGIASVEAPLTYISTVGDVITPEGLTHLVEVIEQHDADVVVSPPRFELAPGAEPSTEPWPILEILQWLEVDQPRALPSHTAYWLAIFYMPQAVLGSAASNLFRTSFLKTAPYPDDCGAAGDTAWTLAHGLRAAFALTPRECASYLHQPGSAMTRRPPPELMRRLRTIAARALEAAFDGTDPDDDGEADALRILLGLLQRAERVETEKVEHRAVLEASRTGGVPWFLSRTAWRARAGRNRGRRAIKAIHAEIEALVKRTLPPTPPGWRSDWRAPLWRYA